MVDNNPSMHDAKRTKILWYVSGLLFTMFPVWLVKMLSYIHPSFIKVGWHLNYFSPCHFGATQWIAHFSRSSHLSYPMSAQCVCKSARIDKKPHDMSTQCYALFTQCPAHFTHCPHWPHEIAQIMPISCHFIFRRVLLATTFSQSFYHRGCSLMTSTNPPRPIIYSLIVRDLLLGHQNALFLLHCPRLHRLMAVFKGSCYVSGMTSILGVDNWGETSFSALSESSLSGCCYLCLPLLRFAFVFGMMFSLSLQVVHVPFI